MALTSLVYLSPAQEDVKVEYYLWQLYHIDHDAKAKRSEMAGDAADADRWRQAHAAAEAKACFWLQRNPIRSTTCHVGSSPPLCFEVELS